MTELRTETATLAGDITTAPAGTISSETTAQADASEIKAVLPYPTPDPYAVYSRFSRYRKARIIFLIAFYGFLSPFSSISVLVATPEVAGAFNTTGDIIGISNALYMVFMAISAPFWAPLSQVYGRRLVMLVSGGLFFAFSLGNIFVTNLAAYFTIRMLIAFQGTSFLVIGAAIVGDIYKPTERGTALSWVLFGSVIGPAMGPLFGGIIITYRPWPIIFVVQAVLAGFAFLLAVVFLPETIHYRLDGELTDLSLRQYIAKIWAWTNPWRVLLLLQHPGIVIVAIASSSIIWNMYSLLTPIRYILNPRFNLTSPIQSAFFYLAPGAGYLFGAALGGEWSDFTLKREMKKRGMVFVPEDRLLATLIPLGLIIPLSMLVYGWTIDKRVGGIPTCVIMMFIQGAGQFFALPSLNTYLLDAVPGRSAELIALNYMMRYMFAAGGTGASLPAISYLGVGWFSTISSVFLMAAAGVVAVASKYGQQWRESSNLGPGDLSQN